MPASSRSVAKASSLVAAQACSARTPGEGRDRWTAPPSDSSTARRAHPICPASPVRTSLSAPTGESWTESSRPRVSASLERNPRASSVSALRPTTSPVMRSRVSAPPQETTKPHRTPRRPATRRARSVGRPVQTTRTAPACSSLRRAATMAGAGASAPRSTSVPSRSATRQSGPPPASSQRWSAGGWPPTGRLTAPPPATGSSASHRRLRRVASPARPRRGAARVPPPPSVRARPRAPRDPRRTAPDAPRSARPR